MNVLFEISDNLTADVAVIGGGTAGVFAAISAAKSGAKTILIEKNSMLGGTITSAGINFPGLFFAHGKQIIDGPCYEAIKRTAELGGAILPKVSQNPEHHWDEQITLNTFIYTCVLFDMCKEAGVQVITNAMITHGAESSDRVDLFITGKSGLFTITCKTVIDATGDADLVRLLDYLTVKSKVLQPATLKNRISGYADNGYNKEEIKEKMATADLPENIEYYNLIYFLESHSISLNIPATAADTSRGKTELEQQSLSDILKVYKFFRTICGLESLEISYFAAETGVRETNRIISETVITADDYINGYFYEDSVCYAFYPIDLHTFNGIEQRFHNDGIVSKIPYSALVPQDSKRILCAGRCISTDTYANSAVRAEATCMATGQVAGCAAAIAAKYDLWVNQIDYNELTYALENINAIVPIKD